jgi:hypothetical protein
MLGLLLERDQSYADIAALLGSSAGVVRERARAALTELGGADPDRNVGLTDYLLGQADPIARADAVRHLREDSDDRALAECVLDALEELAPAAELPRLPGEARTAPHLRAPRLRRGTAPSEDRPSRLGSLSGRQARLLIGLASGAVIMAVAIAAVAGAFSGGSSSSGGSASTPSTNGSGTTTTTAGARKNLTPVALKSVGGSPAKGLATFGLATNDTPFLDVRTKQLAPAPSGQVYSLWLALDPKKRQGYPLAPLTQAHDQFQIPSLILPALPKMKSVDVVVSSTNALRSEIKRVLKAKKPKLILPEPGTLALRGAIPAKTRG